MHRHWWGINTRQSVSSVDSTGDDRLGPSNAFLKQSLGCRFKCPSAFEVWWVCSIPAPVPLHERSSISYGFS